MDERLARIGQLATVARGLEREGAYNGAKLLRASLARELIRYAEPGAPSGAVAVAAALEGLVDSLGSSLPASLAEALRPLPSSIRAGRTISLAEAPRTRVCRVCGETFLGDDVPPACPACEAPALSFHEELPVWYLEPADSGAILAALAAGPRRLALALDAHSDESLGRQPAPGEWSARQALEHLLYAEGLLATRISRLIDEDDPNLAAVATWAETPASDEGSAETGLPASEIAARVGELRHATVGRLAALPDAGWARAGQHPEWGRVTVLSQAAYFARHEASHFAQLVAAAQGRLPGHRP